MGSFAIHLFSMPSVIFGKSAESFPVFVFYNKIKHETNNIILIFSVFDGIDCRLFAIRNHWANVKKVPDEDKWIVHVFEDVLTSSKFKYTHTNVLSFTTTTLTISYKIIV